MKRIKFTKAPTFTKAITGAAIFAVTYLATTSNLPSCSDTVAVLNGNGECIERQSFAHTASGWLALTCLVVAVLLLALKHKDAIQGRRPVADQAYQPQGYQPPSASASAPAPSQPAYQGAPGSTWAPAPVPASRRASSFCAKCGTRIIPGDRFCQGCGIPAGGNES